MKLGIIGSGPDMLTLRKFLTKYDHEYVVYYDDLLWPYGDKPSTLVQAVIADAIQVLEKKGCTHMILPPIWELALRQHLKVLPLFQTYLQEYCFKYSLVGKMGVIGDRSDVQIAQDILTSYATDYTPTDTQRNIKKFHHPFKRRVKEVPLRKYFQTVLSYSDPMANKIVKNDMRYFKDANVDTIIPLNYGYFHYQKTLHTFLNFKKCRLHKLDKLEQCFLMSSGAAAKDPGNNKNMDSLPSVQNDDYSITILYTGQKKLLQRQKKIMRLLQRGQQVQVQREKI